MLNNLFRSNVWDEVAKELSLDRTYLKKQFYLGVYDRIRTKEQETIVLAVLKLYSPLSYKADTNNNKKRRGNYGLIQQTGITETK